MYSVFNQVTVQHKCISYNKVTVLHKCTPCNQVTVLHKCLSRHRRNHHGRKLIKINLPIIILISFSKHGNKLSEIGVWLWDELLCNWPWLLNDIWDISDQLFKDVCRKNLLICTPGAQVDHGLPELLLADAAIIVVVKHLESSPHILHLVTPSGNNLKTNTKEVFLSHLTVPFTVSLHITYLFTLDTMVAHLLALQHHPHFAYLSFTLKPY